MVCGCVAVLPVTVLVQQEATMLVHALQRCAAEKKQRNTMLHVGCTAALR